MVDMSTKSVFMTGAASGGNKAKARTKSKEQQTQTKAKAHTQSRKAAKTNKPQMQNIQKTSLKKYHTTYNLK